MATGHRLLVHGDISAIDNNAHGQSQVCFDAVFDRHYQMADAIPTSNRESS